jgi:hypothetical protein
LQTVTPTLPVAWRLYLPKEWADDEQRRRKGGVPEEVDRDHASPPDRRAHPMSTVMSLLRTKKRPTQTPLLVTQ